VSQLYQDLFRGWLPALWTLPQASGSCAGAGKHWRSLRARAGAARRPLRLAGRCVPGRAWKL